MAFVPWRGSWTSRHYRTKASTAYVIGDTVYSDATDIIPAVSTTEDILGVVEQAKAVGDTTNARIKIRVPRGEDCTMLGDVGTGTLTAAYEGRLCDLKDKDEVNITATTESCLRIVKFHSAALGEFSIIPQKR